MSDYWNSRASHAESIASFAVSYSQVVSVAAVKKVVFGSGVFLKTDLWNEGVEPNRCLLSNLNGCFVGMDISRVVCVKAHSRLRELMVVCCDIRCLPFHGLQGIVDLSTLDHVVEKDAVQVLNQYSEVLRLGGSLFLAFAQQMPFAKNYWGNLDGMYTFNASNIKKKFLSSFSLKSDRGLNSIPLFFMLPPKRWIERVTWHIPKKFQSVFFTVFLLLEKPICVLFKEKVGLRLFVGVKK